MTVAFVPPLMCSCCSRQKVDMRLQRIPTNDLRVRAIIMATCIGRNVKASELFSHRRHRRLSEARVQIAGELRRIGFSFPAIGRVLGRDHSSVMAMVRKVERMTA